MPGAPLVEERLRNVLGMNTRFFARVRADDFPNMKSGTLTPRSIRLDNGQFGCQEISLRFAKLAPTSLRIQSSLTIIV